MRKGYNPKKMKEQRSFQVRRDFLRREQEYGQANLAKYTKKWSRMLNKISCDHLRKEATSYWHSFNKVVDYKDMEISVLLDWIEEENQRYWICLSNHNQMMEHMINYFFKTHTQIYNELGTQVNKLITIWVQDYDLNKTRAMLNEEFLETMKYQMECTRKREEFETVTTNFSILDEKSTKYKFLLSYINYILSDKLQKLYVNMDVFTKDYFASTGKRQKMGAESMEKFESLQKDIVANQKRKIELEKLFHLLIEKYKDLSHKNGQKLDSMMKERDDLHECFMVLRENLFYDKNNDTSKRQVLSVSFNETFQELGKLAKKGSTMLKFLGACRRYETAQEKALPYPMIVDKYEISKNKDFSYELRLFWNRLAAANAIRYTLNEERTYLKAENQNLLEQIHSHCKCLKCPPLPPIPQRAGKIPYTEGREMVQKQKTQNRTKD